VGVVKIQSLAPSLFAATGKLELCGWSF